MLKRHLKNSFNLLLAVAMIFTLILASVAATGVTTIEGKSSGVQVTSSSALTISPEEIELVAGGESATLTLTSTIHPTVQNAKWSSSNQSVATVNKGVVTPVSPGTAVITATISSDKSQYATCFVTVLSPSTIYYRLTYSAGTGGYVLGELSQTVNQGGSGTAVEAIPNENYHFVGWSDGRDDNPRTDANVMANVDVAANFAIDNQETYLLTLAANPKEGGTVTGGGNYAPETTVRVVAVPNSGYDFEYWTLETTPVSNSATFDYTMPASDTTLVAVFKTAESSSVMVSPTSMILTVGGEDGTIAVTQNPSHPTNRNIKWSSSNTGVATVNNGVVRAISPGVATITASNSSGSGTCQVTVNPALPKLFVVTFSDPSNGSMTASVEGALISSGSSVTEGKDILFTTVPNLGHEVSSWRVNGTVVAGETGLTYTYRNLDRNIAVEVMLKEPDLKVASVASVSTKYVDYGTPFGSVGLPSTIEATLEDGSKTNLGVTWSKGSYDENVAGTYTVEGTLTMKTGVVNPDGVKASAQIVVNEKPDLKVASVASVSTKYVDYGTPFGSVGLPSTIEATLEDGSKTNLGVTWSKGSYDENVAGTYTVEGTLTMKTGVVNPDGVKASAQIVVNEKPDLKVASVASVSTKYVDYGTPFGSVGLPSTIEATLEDGSKTNLGVTWSKGSYDENVAGTYTVEGTLTMKTGVVNPDGVKASAQIVVNEEPNAKVFVSYNPYGKVNWDTYSQNKANFHTHTRESDGGRVPNEVIDLYHGAGYKILSLTDHAYASGHPTTWPWTKWGKDPVQLGMLAVEGNEVSGTDHTGSFFSSYDGSTNDIRTALNEIKSRNGMAVFFHPGRYNRSDSWYQTFYNDFDKTLVGMEVYNQGDRHPGDRAKWDRVNALVMPNVVVFGYSNDDMHADHELFRNYQFMLMPSLTEGALRESMLNGAFYFSYEPGGSGNINPPVPRISRIEVTSGGTVITISATNTSSVTWRTNKGVAGTGASIDLKTLDLEGAKFIRAELQNGSGKSYTQPFVLQSN